MDYSSSRVRLTQEIKNLHAAILNGITMRREHPSYGYTKGSLFDQLNRLTGMIEAHLIITGNWDKPGDPAVGTSAYAAGAFQIELAKLAVKIQES